MEIERLVLWSQVASTLILVGLIWTIQVVHYPLFDGVGEEEFVAYHARHSRAITWLVAPLMLVELAGACAWAVSRPVEMPTWAVWMGILLVGVVWASTAFLQVPRHNELAAGFAASPHQALVATNWLRTWAWTARGVLVLWVSARNSG